MLLSYVFVRVTQITFVLKNPHCVQFRNMQLKQIFNVGMSEANISKKELCQIIQKQIEEFTFIDSPIGKDPDQRNYIVSNKKIEATGFKTSMTLDLGIAELIKGYMMIKNNCFGSNI